MPRARPRAADALTSWRCAAIAIVKNAVAYPSTTQFAISDRDVEESRNVCDGALNADASDGNRKIKRPARSPGFERSVNNRHEPFGTRFTMLVQDHSIDVMTERCAKKRKVAEPPLQTTTSSGSQIRRPSISSENEPARNPANVVLTTRAHLSAGARRPRVRSIASSINVTTRIGVTSAKTEAPAVMAVPRSIGTGTRIMLIVDSLRHAFAHPGRDLCAWNAART